MTTMTTDPVGHADHTGHHSHKPLYLKVFAALMVLLVLTVGAAFIPLGGANLPVALGIAVLKSALILLFFMHFRDSDHVTWLVGGATVFWFGILIVLTLNDYVTRDWLSIPGK